MRPVGSSSVKGLSIFLRWGDTRIMIAVMRRNDRSPINNSRIMGKMSDLLRIRNIVSTRTPSVVGIITGELIIISWILFAENSGSAPGSPPPAGPMEIYDASDETAYSTLVLLPYITTAFNWSLLETSSFIREAKYSEENEPSAR